MAATTVAQRALVSPALEDKAHYEVVNGQRMETPRIGSYESDLANDLACDIIEHFARLGRLGRVVIEVLSSQPMTTPSNKAKSRILKHL